MRVIRLALAWLVLLAAAAPAAWAANPIQVENAKPGTPGWDLPGGTATRLPSASQKIQGYASAISVQPGETLQLHVSTSPAAAYRIEIFRLGWYHGLGGRRVACRPSCIGNETGYSWPVPAPDPQTGYLDAGWPVTDAIAVGSDWTSGYFVAKLILTSGPDSGQASWIPFVVRAAPGAKSTILVQASVNTWEAYSSWGGKSLYPFNSSGPVVPASGTVAAAMVSFERPLGTDLNAGPFSWEYQLVRYVERSGYDVSYQTDVDTDSGPSSLLGHRLDIVNGHDEYWSPAMRSAYEAARAAGVNLAFTGGNIGVWQARYQSGDTTLIEYRSAKLDPDPDPAQKTVPFSQPPVSRPECQLLGVGYPGGATNPADPPRSYSVTAGAASNAWFAGTGLSPGSSIFDSVGYEWDSVQAGCAVPALTVLLHFPGLHGVQGSPAGADAVTYTASSGARIFSDGSMQLTWALDDFGHPAHADQRVQHLFANIFDDLGAPPGPNPPTGVPVLESPGAGAVIRSPVGLRWSDTVAGPRSYLVILDGALLGAFSGACPRGTCVFSRRLSQGAHTWQLIATDPLGNTLPSGSARFVVDNTPPSRFALRWPKPSGTLYTRRPRFRWRPARDRLAGIANYILIIDGRRVGHTRKLSLLAPHRLKPGRHTWSVIAIDGAGNTRRTGTRTFLVVLG